MKNGMQEYFSALSFLPNQQRMTTVQRDQIQLFNFALLSRRGKGVGESLRIENSRQTLRISSANPPQKGEQSGVRSRWNSQLVMSDGRHALRWILLLECSLKWYACRGRRRDVKSLMTPLEDECTSLPLLTEDHITSFPTESVLRAGKFYLCVLLFAAPIHSVRIECHHLLRLHRQLWHPAKKQSGSFYLQSDLTSKTWHTITPTNFRAIFHQTPCADSDSMNTFTSYCMRYRNGI